MRGRRPGRSRCCRTVVGAVVAALASACDLPLFRTKDHRLRQCNRVYPRCSQTAMGCYRRSCTNMDETKTETGGPADLESAVLRPPKSMTVCLCQRRTRPRILSGTRLRAMRERHQCQGVAVADPSPGTATWDTAVVAISGAPGGSAESTGAR